MSIPYFCKSKAEYKGNGQTCNGKRRTKFNATKFIK